MKKHMKLNAAVFMLSGRKKILPITLDLFYKNWNNYYKYPLFIFTLNKVYSKNEIIEALTTSDEANRLSEIHQK